MNNYERCQAAGLDDRESRILQLVGLGWNNVRIGADMGYSAHTVSACLTRIYERIGVDNRVSASLWLHGIEVPCEH